MKKTIFLSSLILPMVLLSASETVESLKVNYVDNLAIQAKGMKQIKGLVGGLKPTLMKSFKQDKTGVAGMVMCSQSAQKMGQNYNATLPKDSKVRRTAIKYRNPNNKPDATDSAVMERMVQEHNFKKPLVVDMGSYFRVYKALPTHKPCLACHGDKEKMPQKMKEILAENYPADLAVGFKEGDFRGVIVSEIQK